MKTWVGSDFHWNHKNIMKFCPETRGHYRDIAHMNSDMIVQWNNLVSPEDLVYMLGDVAFTSGFEASKIMSSLNGRKILIKGNHDSKTVKDFNFKNSFEEIHDYLVVNYDKHRIVMFHYPIFDHDQAGRGSIMLHGHRHGNPTGIPGRIMDVGLDATGKILSSLDEIVTKMLSISPLHHHPPR